MTEKKTHFLHILMVGYYGFKNLGDEAILTGIIKGIRSLRDTIKITVISRHPELTSKTHKVNSIFWFDFSGIYKTVQDTDLVILGGGGLFHDYWSFDPDSLLTPKQSGISYYTGQLFLASLLEKPVVLYSVGIGPIFTPAGEMFTKAVFDMAKVSTVRDAESFSMLESIGVNTSKISVTADPAFLLTCTTESRNKKILEIENCPENRPLIGVSVRHWNINVSSEIWERQVAEALDNVLDRRNGSVLFIPFQKIKGKEIEDDQTVINRIKNMMKHSLKTSVIEGDYSPEEVAGIFSHCDIILGMRLHSIIFSILNATPVIALGYDPKVSNLMKRVGCGDYVVDLKDITSNKITILMNKALKQGESLSQELKKAHIKLKKLAMSDIYMVNDLVDRKQHLPFTINESSMYLLRHLISGHISIADQLVSLSNQKQEMEKIIDYKETELNSQSKRLQDLITQINNNEKHHSQKINEKDRELDSMKNSLSLIEERLNAIKRSKTLRTIQFIRKLIGLKPLN
jgi:polysaccharide pyruvyl transferase CsaB